MKLRGCKTASEEDVIGCTNVGAMEANYSPARQPCITQPLPARRKSQEKGKISPNLVVCFHSHEITNEGLINISFCMFSRYFAKTGSLTEAEP
jgi:hypothetical protein